MAEIRVYGVIHADFPSGSVSEEQWQSLTSAARSQPLADAITTYARQAQNYIQAHKRSLNASALRNYTLFGFEVSRDDVDRALTFLDAQTLIHGVMGNTTTRFQGVLQAELRLAALGLGYTPTQTTKLSVIGVIADNRADAIQQAQTYLANNAGIWYE